MITQSTIDEIKSRMDIVDVVGDYVNLKKSGSSYKALSPFTTEKTPSFFVVPSKGIFKCFSSGKGGDAIKFLMEMDGLSYVEALKYLAEKYGIEIVEENQTDEALQAQNKRESLYIVLNYACEYFEDLLKTHEDGKSIGMPYFLERGITEEFISEFRLGYSLDQWDGLYKNAIEKGFSKDLLEEAGLVIRKEDRIYDRFRARVIFPIQNVSGKVIAFGARTLSSDKNQPKYINSPETELYNKSHVLYGIFQAKQSLRSENNCYLVEGYTDVISLHQVGVRNVVASSGTAFTSEQARLIKRYTENVTILFDGDPAGIRASFRGVDILLENGLNVRVVALPDGEDPDSYSKQLGTTAFQHFITSNARDFIAYKTSMLIKEVANDPVKKAGVIKDIIESITKIDDAVKRSLYIKESSTLLGISESVLIVEQNKILQERNKERRKAQFEIKEEVPTDLLPLEDEQVDSLDINQVITFQEKESIRLLLNFGKEFIKGHKSEDQQLIEYILLESEEINFIHTVYRRILDHFRKNYQEGRIVGVDYFMSIDDEEIQQVVIELIAPRYEISEFWKAKYDIHIPKEVDHLRDSAYTNILRLKFRVIQRLLEEEKNKLKEVTDDKLDMILEEFEEMKKIQIELAEILGNVTVK